MASYPCSGSEILGCVHRLSKLVEDNGRATFLQHHKRRELRALRENGGPVGAAQLGQFLPTRQARKAHSARSNGQAVRARRPSLKILCSGGLRFTGETAICGDFLRMPVHRIHDCCHAWASQGVMNRVGLTTAGLLRLRFERRFGYIAVRFQDGSTNLFETG